MKRMSHIQSVLWVDDDEASLNLYVRLMSGRLRIRYTPVKYPGVAIKLAQQHFFDIIVVDVTMNYNGTPFGGLELYKSLIGRYGTSSLLAYSQFITDDLLKQYEYNFNFCERGVDHLKFVKDLSLKIDSMRKQQTCFVAMPFERKYESVYQAIEQSVGECGYCCARVDRQHFTKSIIEQILDQIKEAKVVIFLAAGKNANAFYECGYAVALGKEVITVTDHFTNLPFDIRDRNAIQFGTNLKLFKSQLVDRLKNLTHV
jgi:CheY-like chemotaxis protein